VPISRYLSAAWFTDLPHATCLAAPSPALAVDVDANSGEWPLSSANDYFLRAQIRRYTDLQVPLGVVVTVETDVRRGRIESDAIAHPNTANRSLPEKQTAPASSYPFSRFSCHVDAE